MANYTLEKDPHPPTYHQGVRFRVLRDGVEVASIFEDPSRTGGREVYGTASVSMSAVLWSGRLPDGSNAHLGFDFVSDFEAAPEVLPEVTRRVEALLAWRKETAS